MTVLNQTSRKILLVAILGLVFLVGGAACRAPETPAPTPTETSVPTRTTRPTQPLPPTATLFASTLRPTSTPIPTATLVPRFTPIPPTATDTPLPVFAGAGDTDAPLIDTFGDPASGWPISSEDMFGFDYVDGTYEIYNNFFNEDACASRTRDFNNVIIDVDVTHVSGSLSAYGAVTCRKTELDFYALGVNAQGEWFIFRTVNNERELLFRGEDSAILQGEGVTNRLQVKCLGPILSLTVNGTEVVSQLDSFLSRGNFVGLINGTLGDSPAVMRFDNFYARAP